MAALLGLGVCRRNQSAYQGWLLPVLGPRAGQEKSPDTLMRFACTCFCLPLSAGCLLGSVTERASGCTEQGLNSIWWGKKESKGGAIAFPQADVTLRRVLYSRMMVSAV